MRLAAMVRGLGCSLAVLCSAATASAQSTEAEDYLQRGIEARRAGDEEAALALFRQALALESTGRAHAQVGFAHQALGQWVEARHHLARALESGDPWVEERRAVIQNELAYVEGHLGRAEIVGPPGAMVSIDGVERGTLPLAEPLHLRVGTVTLRVSADGFHDAVRQMDIRSGETTREDITMEPVSRGGSSEILPSAPERPERIESDYVEPPRAFSPGLIVLSAAAGAAIITSAVTYGFARRSLNEWNDITCLVDNQTREENCGSTRDTMYRLRNASIGLLVGGVALGAAVVTLWRLRARGTNDHHIACNSGPGQVGLSCALLF